MSFIGPNFRPPGQQSPMTNARPSEQTQPGTGAALGHQAGQPTGGPQHGPPAGTLSLAALMAQQNPLAPDQLAQLLRNLLKMPREIVQFLSILAQQDPAAGQELLQRLMTEEVKVPLEEMQNFLEGRLGQAQEKLLKLAQGNPAAMAGTGELGELMKGLSELAAKTGQSPAEAMHSTITLYLPFYPLHPPQAFSLRFEPPAGEEEASGEQSPQLVIYIETLSMGQFRATVLTGPQSRWQAVIEHDASAAEHTGTIESDIQSLVPLEKPELIFVQRDKPAKPIPNQPLSGPKPDTNTESAPKQAVGLHPSEGVSVLAVHAAYLLIRVILELDNRNALHQGRASL